MVAFEKFYKVNSLAVPTSMSHNYQLLLDDGNRSIIPQGNFKVYLTFLLFSECWNPEPHNRPTFQEILHKLEEIKCSSFIHTPQDSYNTMQADWKLEIEQMFDELRAKEKVDCFI